jgi:hypothetical protein
VVVVVGAFVVVREVVVVVLVVLGDAVVIAIEAFVVIDVAGAPDELAVPETVITMGFVVHATVVAVLALPQD